MTKEEIKEMLPYPSNKEINRILEDDVLTLSEKARQIHKYAFNLSCLETNGYTKWIDSASRIELILTEYFKED